MKVINGYTQKNLDEIWQSLHNDKSDSSAELIFESSSEQLMIVNTPKGHQICVARSPGKRWYETWIDMP